MLEKDPQKRLTIEKIAQLPWINEEMELPLEQELKINKLESVTEQEINNALQISTVTKLKSWVSKWKEGHREASNVYSQQSGE